jgi:hypothetical protein
MISNFYPLAQTPLKEVEKHWRYLQRNKNEYLLTGICRRFSRGGYKCAEYEDVSCSVQSVSEYV